MNFNINTILEGAFYKIVDEGTIFLIYVHVKTFINDEIYTITVSDGNSKQFNYLKIVKGLNVEVAKNISDISFSKSINITVEPFIHLFNVTEEMIITNKHLQYIIFNLKILDIEKCSPKFKFLFGKYFI